MQAADIVIAGAGIAGCALALELRRHGCSVVLLQRPRAGTASMAAAGMLAGHDPHNPEALRWLSDLALTLYPDFLDRIRGLSNVDVQVQTRTVLEPGGAVELRTHIAAASTEAGAFCSRPEQSLDPRQLLPALTAATHRCGVRWLALDGEWHVREEGGHVRVHAGTQTMEAGQFVDCTGAWSASSRPAKGQMLRVQPPKGSLALRDGSGNAVVRTESVYIVPRLDCSAIIGATVEDKGFDVDTCDDAMAGLRGQASALIPALAHAPLLEQWAGLRPRTRDDLPVLGAIAPNRFVAGGLFRNGILLAPAVAQVMTQLLLGTPPQVPLAQFSAARFGSHTDSHPSLPLTEHAG